LVLPEETAFFEELAQAWDLTPSAERSARLQAFVSRMLEWNARINLTGAKSRQELVGEHLVDSFVISRFLPAGCSLVDIGAGGGLPGIPLAVLRPDVRLTLVEPRAKRVAFLRTVVHELALQSVEVLRCRSDDLKAGAFDVCVSRATFPPEEWLRVGRGLARVGGLVLVLANARLEAADTSARLVNSAEYTTVCGRSRWMGAFCFT
jgi:16S rRNA (guanine527-N7)-methyltransferase